MLLLFYKTMELLLGIVTGVLVSFLALYLTKKLWMVEEEMARDAQRDAHNDRVLLEVVDPATPAHTQAQAP